MKFKRLSIFLFICFLFLFTFFQLAQCSALGNTILFQDDFDDDDAKDWEEYNGSGGWQVKNKIYEGTITLIRPEDPAYSVNGNSEWSDYIFEVDIRGTEGVDKGTIFRYRTAYERYQFSLVSQWSGGGNLIDLYKLSPYQSTHLIQKPFVNYPNRWYRLKIVVANIDQDTTNIKLYVKDLDNDLDHGLVLEYNDNYYPITNGKIGLYMWPGGYEGEGSVTTTQYDNIVVSGLVPLPSPDPIVLLPGLGASWNHEAMILNTPKDPEEWYMTPFVKTYDGLIQTLKNAGYEDVGVNRDLFIFNYDWRQSIETTATQLKDYIKNTVDPPSETKIDLIGHSLGGMVARTYIQSNSDHQVDQLITIGSPHKGAPKVYYLWEGADLKKVLQPWQRIGAGILLHLNKKDYQNNVETIRDIIPGLKDLLPTFPYLKQDGSEKPLLEMSQRNSWLESLNHPPLPGFLTSVLNTFFGIKENSTLRWINIEDRNRFDQFLGKWEDGRPVGEEFDDGDETVLVESAQLEDAAIIGLSGLNHRELVDDTVAQEAIIDLLGVSPSEFGFAEEVIYEPSLVFQIASPANLTIMDPDGTVVVDGKKLVFIPNPKEGNYQIFINPENSGGPYRLLIGKITAAGDSWTEISGEVSAEPEEYVISFAANPQENKLELLNLAKKSLLAAERSAEELPKPLKILSTKAIQKRINQIEAIIVILEKNKENRAQIKIRQTIFSLSILEKNFRIWTRVFGLDPEIQNELRIAKDYLLQVYEL